MTGRDPFDFGRSPTPGSGGSGYGGSGYGGSGYGGGGYEGSGYGGSGYAAPADDDRASGTQQAPVHPGPPPPADDLVGRPPLGWLVAALVLGVAAAIVAGLFGEDVTVAALAWFLAGPVGIALVALYSRRDTAARARPIYDAPVVLGLLRWATGIALAAGIVVGALRIAAWAGRL